MTAFDAGTGAEVESTRRSPDPTNVPPPVVVLHELVEPASVADIGSGQATWAYGFRSLGVDDVLLIRPPLDPSLGYGNLPTLAHDLRQPLLLDRRFDLAVSVGAGEHVPAEVAPVLVASLCGAAEVVAFAAAIPGLAPPGTVNARWPLWWDSLFETHGYTPHDIVRPHLWEDERIDLTIRQGLVLYARAGRFAPVPISPGMQRSVVHPEAFHVALHRSETRRRDDRAMAVQGSLALEAHLLQLADEIRRLTADLESEREQRAAEPRADPGVVVALEKAVAVAEAQIQSGRRDVALMKAAVAATERQVAAGPSTQLLSAATRPGAATFVGRSLTGALPLRRRLRGIIGPTAPLWDEAWYLSHSPDVLATRLSPLWHYRRHGTRLRRSPHPWFDPEWYATRYPEVVSGGADPVEHYLRSGWREGRDPHPLFDTRWYERRHAAPDGWRRSPLEHYLDRGRAAGLSPHPLLDARWYLQVNADVRRCDDDPADHFVRRGWREGHDPHPLFDVGWYLESNPDVARAGVNPLVHYVWFGWREGRGPNPWFDTSWYLVANPDVAEAGLEPLSHYITVGAAEGRATSPLFDTSWYVDHHPESAADGRNPLVFFLEIGCARGDVGSAGAEPTP